MRPAFLVLVAAAVADGASKHHAKDRAYRAAKRECENGVCSNYAPDTGYNCVHECVSAPCYADVYAAEPLEDGEVDAKRSRLFLACVRKEQAARRRAESDARKQKRLEKRRAERGEEA